MKASEFMMTYCPWYACSQSLEQLQLYSCLALIDQKWQWYWINQREEWGRAGYLIKKLQASSGDTTKHGSR
jgi:hypothetical protein